MRPALHREDRALLTGVDRAAGMAETALAQFARSTGAQVALLALWDPERQLLVPGVVRGASPLPGRTPVIAAGVGRRLGQLDRPALVPTALRMEELGLTGGPEPAVALVCSTVTLFGRPAGLLVGAFTRAPEPEEADALVAQAAQCAEMAAACLETAEEVAGLYRSLGVDRETACLDAGGLAQILDEECERCERHGRPLTCVVLAPRSPAAGWRPGPAAQRILDHVRPYDRVALVAGVFVTILPETDLPQAADVARRLHEAVAGDGEDPLQWGLGVAAWTPGCAGGELVEAAEDLARQAGDEPGRLLAGVAGALPRPGEPETGGP